MNGLSKTQSAPVYLCERHGKVPAVITVSMNIPQDGEYCQVCYAEHLERTCCKVSRLEGPQ